MLSCLTKPTSHQMSEKKYRCSSNPSRPELIPMSIFDSKGILASLRNPYCRCISSPQPSKLSDRMNTTAEKAKAAKFKKQKVFAAFLALALFSCCAHAAQQE